MAATKRNNRYNPDFRQSYIRIDENTGNVSIPEQQNVRGIPTEMTGMDVPSVPKSMCKSSMPIDVLAQDIVRKYNLNSQNLATVGERVAKDMAQIEQVSFEDLFEEVTRYVEGPVKVPPSIGQELMLLFRHAHRSHNGKGEDHPDTLHKKQDFEDKYGTKLPKDLWNLPLKQAEEAFIGLQDDEDEVKEVESEKPKTEKKSEPKKEEQTISLPEDAEGFLVIPVKVDNE